MEPTLRSGSLFVYDRHYYHGKPVRRGDVVVLRGRRGFWIKRVYATEDARFWVWRQPMEGYLRRDPVNAAQQARFKSLAAYQRELGLPVRLERFRVPPGHVFVVGDGPVSEDSRELGTVPVTSIVGRVVYPARRHETWTPRLVEYRFPEPRGAASRLSHAKPRERSAGRRALAQRSPSQRAGRLPATGHPRLVGSYSRPPAERPIANPVPSLRF
jgi:signal peptidase I